jgi:nitrous oxidase accessory protein
MTRPAAAGASAAPAAQAAAATQAADPSVTEQLRAMTARAGAALRRVPALRPVGVLLGAALLVVAGSQPIWGSRLIAPQYPKGLELWFYGGRVEGPLSEVNGLNHYIGMREIDLSVVPEMALWPLAVLGSTLLLIVAAFSPGWLGRLALLGLWLVPVTVLANIQRWLIIFGSELDRTAALRLDPFIPWVVGPSSVWNFTVWNVPGNALWLIWSVAIIATVLRWGRPASRRTSMVAGVAALLIAAVGTLWVVMPSAGSYDGVSAKAHEAAPHSAQALIDAASPGATIVLPAGIYHERLVVDRPLTLIAGGEVVIDGGGRGSVVTVTADDVTLRGLHVVGSGGQGEEGAGVTLVDASRVTLEKLRIRDSFTGIAALGGADVRIVDCELTGAGQSLADGGHALGGQGSEGTPGSGSAGAGLRLGQGDGIHLWTVRGALVRGTTISEVRDGLYLNYAEEVLVDSNRITSSRYAVHAMFGRDLTFFGNRLEDNLSGLVFMYSRNVLAGRNTVTGHRSSSTGMGVVLKDVTGVRLAENIIAGNRVGLRAEGTAHAGEAKAEVLRNRFAGNDVGVWVVPSANVGFGGNSFDGNLTTVLATDHGVERRNQWTYQGTGNYWSDYAGYDLAGDGIGDVAHVSYGAANALLEGNRALGLYATSPAFQVLAQAQEQWAAAGPAVVTDRAPLTIEVAPRADRDGRAGGGAWAALAGGLIGIGLGAHFVHRLRRCGIRLMLKRETDG